MTEPSPVARVPDLPGAVGFFVGSFGITLVVPISSSTIAMKKLQSTLVSIPRGNLAVLVSTICCSVTCPPYHAISVVYANRVVDMIEKHGYNST